MRYKNFLYLSRRCKNELTKKTPCKYMRSVFTVSSYYFSGGFSYLEEHYKRSTRLLCEFYNGTLQRKYADQKVKTRTIKDINRSFDFYKRCLMLLDFYKKV